MKTKILKLSTVILFLLFIGASCQDDEDLFEIQIGDENAVIQKEIDGIEFKFCLLNDDGEPSTVFNEGENFTFQFSIKNNINDTLPFSDYGFYKLNDFYAVKSIDNYYGKAFSFVNNAYSENLRMLPPGEEYYKLLV